MTEIKNIEPLCRKSSVISSLERWVDGKASCFNDDVEPQVRNTVHRLYSEWLAVKNTDTDNFSDKAKKMHGDQLQKSFLRLLSNIPYGFIGLEASDD